jgi:hypothetical protein
MLLFWPRSGSTRSGAETVRHLSLVVVLVLSSFCAHGQAPPAEPSATGEASIEGFVVKAVTGEPLPKAWVSLRQAGGGKETLSAITGPDGRFVLKEIPAGHYLLWARADGYITAEYGQRDLNQAGSVLLLDPDSALTNVVFRLVPAAAISGRVFNEEGEPLVKVLVQALRSGYSQGTQHPAPVSFEVSNDQGEYRLQGLPAGKYYVTATFRPGVSTVAGGRGAGPAPGSMYAPTFYPGTTEPARAVPVELQQGGETSGIDITLLDSTGVTVRGRILRNPTARPLKHMNIDLSPRNPGGRTAFVPPPAAADGDGNFQIRNVLPGSYMLTVSWDDGERRHTGRQTVEVTNADVDGVTVVADVGLELSGRLRVEGDPPLDLTRFRVSLSSTGEAPLGAPSSPVGTNGDFLLQDVEADTYRVAVGGLSGSLYLKSVKLGGHDALGPGLDLTTGTARGPLEILISPEGGRIEGTVVRDQNTPWPSARVVLVPSGVLRPRTDLYKQRMSDPYGQFAITGIPPGEYKLFAWQEVELEAYQDPDFLRLYEDQGVTVTVQERGILSVQLSLIPSRNKLP